MRPSVGRAPNTTGRGQWPWVALELPCGPLVLYLSIYLFMKLVTNRKRASCVALWLVRLLTFVEQKKKKKKKRKTAGRITKTDSSAGLGPVGCRAYSTANKQDNQRSSGAGGSKTPDEAAHISQQATPRRQRSQRRGTGNLEPMEIAGGWPSAAVPGLGCRTAPFRQRISRPGHGHRCQWRHWVWWRHWRRWGHCPRMAIRAWSGMSEPGSPVLLWEIQAVMDGFISDFLKQLNTMNATFWYSLSASFVRLWISIERATHTMHKLFSFFSS